MTSFVLPSGRRIPYRVVVLLVPCLALVACGQEAASPAPSAGGFAAAAGGAEASRGGTTMLGGSAGMSAGRGASPPTEGGPGGRNTAGSDAAGGDGGAGPATTTAGAAGRDQGGANLGGAGGNSASSAGAAGMAAAGATSQVPTTVWIAGDSTVMTYAAGNTKGNDGASLEGWGQELAPFFNEQVTIDNQAIGGRSVAFFMWTVETDGSGTPQCIDDQGTPKFRRVNGEKVDTAQWAKIKTGIKPGDFLLIQFGHNDETHTCPRFVSVNDYATYLGFMAETAIAQGATPIFVTPMGHRTFTGSKFNNTLLPYAQSMKGAAMSERLEVVDLNLRSGEYYEKVGNSFLATNIFDGGTTHFIKAGAVEMATLIVGELKKQAGPLASYLK